VQRYFSTFPGSWPGVGLLLLRIVVGGAASLQGIACLTHINDANALLWIGGGLALVSGAAVVAGFLTPASGAVAGLATSFIVAAWTPPGGSMRIDPLTALILIVNAAALALLGPGAHSLDARLFGRREIVIPPDPRRSARVSKEA